MGGRSLGRGRQRAQDESAAGRFYRFEAPFGRQVCTYCGDPADTVDHVYPLSAAARLADHSLLAAPELAAAAVKVPACRECNTLLGAHVAGSWRERQLELKARLKRRYRRVLEAPEWQAEERAANAGELGRHVDARLSQARRLRARLAWPCGDEMAPPVVVRPPTVPPVASPPPPVDRAWLDVLAGACARVGQQAVADALGYSRAVVSQVLAGKYRGKLAAVEEAVRRSLMGADVFCAGVEVWIPRARCDGLQRRGFSFVNPMVNRIRQACPGCVHRHADPAEDGKTENRHKSP